MAGDDPLSADSSVSWSVKELFDRLDSRLVSIDGKLDGKVNTSDFIAFQTQTRHDFDDHEGRLGDLETAEAGRRGITAWATKTWVILGSLGTLGAAIAAAIGIAIGGH